MKPEPTPRSGKFIQESTNIVTKIKHLYHYDLDKFPNGPYKTEIVYPEGYKTINDDIASANKGLPITKQMFLNPANNKYVGYGRAVQLGLYKPENAGGGRGRPKKK